MGLNDTSVEVLEWIFATYPHIKSVLELGSQNFYHTYPSVKYGDYADKYYKAKGVTTYECIDLNGENDAKVWDLSKPIAPFGVYDLVTDFGTQEHISTEMSMEALYNCWATKYFASSRFIVSANPKTGNWPGHGAYFFTPKFYEELAFQTRMRIVKLNEKPAMGNTTDGWEIMCLLEKTPASRWISPDEFATAFAWVSSQ
jgi:hypothetical protein